MEQMTIDLNGDCGEGYGAWHKGDDAAFLPFLSSANIACGGHAGDPATMYATLKLCRELGIAAGAHPGYPDLLGFGRRSLALTPHEVTLSVLAQIGALAAIAKVVGVALRHVKPHGALYNDAAKRPELAAAIASAVAAFSRELVLVGLSGSLLIEAGEAAGLRVAREAFADRAYEADGALRDRQKSGALILEPAQCLDQSLQIVDGHLRSIDGTPISVRAETICLHGDHPDAVARASYVRQGLHSAGIAIAPLI